MTTQEILALPYNEESILIIHDYLDHTSLGFSVYQTVFSYLMEMKLSLGYHQQVVAEADAYYKKYLHQDFLQNHEYIFHLIIQAALKLELFDMALTYIELRRQALPMMKKHLITYDVIMYKKALNQPYESDLEAVLADVIPDKDRLIFYKELLNLYLMQNNYLRALAVIDDMKAYDPEKSYLEHELNLLLLTVQYDKAKELALKTKGHPLYDLKAFMVLLEIYIKEKDDHRIAILEADYEDRLESLSIENQVKVFSMLSNLYKSMGNKLSFDLYQKKLKSAQRQLDKKQAQVKETSVAEKVASKDTPKLPVFNISEPKAVHSHMLAQLEWSFDLLTYSHQISETKQVRDYLRSFFMKADEILNVKEYIIYVNQGSMLYQYKKERLYDKEIIINHVYETIVEDINHHGDDVADVPSKLKFDKNIVTQLPYDKDVQFVYAYPLSDFGVFLVHMSEEISDPSIYYDVFKMMSAMLTNHLIDEQKMERLRSENTFLNQLIESPLFSMRITSENYTTYNIEAQKLLDAEIHLPLELFYIDLEYHFVKQYQETIQTLFARPNQSKELVYLYQNKHIREKMYSIKDKDEIKIVSLFEDLTQVVAEKDSLVEKATIDFETNLLNLNALNEHMPLYIKDKGSFILIEMDDSLKTVYGYEQTLLFFKEFGQLTKKHFHEGMVYRFNAYQLFLYVPYNDIRTVSKALKDYLRFVTTYQPQSIMFERFRPSMSIIRYPVVTEEKLPAKLYRYLELTLDHLKQKNRAIDDMYEFFEYKIYEEDQFEQQVIDFLNDAIEHKQLEITFNQIIDVKRNVVWQYESELVLSNMNIDAKYLLAIAKKRHRLVEIEKYHIKLVCEYLNFLEKETGRLVKITIPVSKETFLETDFNAYLVGTFKHYHIPAEFIRLKVKAQDFKSHQYLAQVQELIDLGIGLDTTSLDAALSYPFHALHLDIRKAEEKWYDYVGMLKNMMNAHQMAVVIRGIASKEQKEALLKREITYIEGNIYKKIAPGALLAKVKERS